MDELLAAPNRSQCESDGKGEGRGRKPTEASEDADEEKTNRGKKEKKGRKREKRERRCAATGPKRLPGLPGEGHRFSRSPNFPGHQNRCTLVFITIVLRRMLEIGYIVLNYCITG